MVYRLPTESRDRRSGNDRVSHLCFSNSFFTWLHKCCSAHVSHADAYGDGDNQQRVLAS